MCCLIFSICISQHFIEDDWLSQLHPWNKPVTFHEGTCLDEDKGSYSFVYMFFLCSSDIMDPGGSRLSDELIYCCTRERVQTPFGVHGKNYVLSESKSPNSYLNLKIYFFNQNSQEQNFKKQFYSSAMTVQMGEVFEFLWFFRGKQNINHI